MEAAIKLGDKIKKLAMYEAPYNSDEAARRIQYSRGIYGKLITRRVVFFGNI